MNNFYSLGMDWGFEKDRAISALSLQFYKMNLCN